VAPWEVKKKKAKYDSQTNHNFHLILVPVMPSSNLNCTAPSSFHSRKVPSDRLLEM
jgi:hypothetical protein